MAYTKRIVLIAVLLLFSCREDTKTAIEVQPAGNVSIEAEKEITAAPAAFESEDEVVDGWLRAGADEKTVTDKLGREYEAGVGEMSHVNGMHWQQWAFKDKGIILLMESETADSPKSVAQITLVGPSGLKTSRGIAIGCTAGDVRKAYADVINNKESSGQSIVAGSIYSGVIFTIADHAVSEIFIGAAAE